jgi:ketosteroid isomerase-like protein
MTDHENARITREALAAFVAGDIEATLATMADDVVWHAPGTNRFSGRFDGKAAVADRFRRMAEAGLQTSFEVHDVIANDEHVVALVQVSVTSASGKRYDGPQVQVVHVRGGKATEFWGMNQDQAAADVVMNA